MTDCESRDYDLMMEWLRTHRSDGPDNAFLAGLAAGRAEVQAELKNKIVGLTLQLEASQDALTDTMNDCAALRKRIDDAPRWWVVFGADGRTPIHFGHEVECKAWAECENEEMGVAHGYIAEPFAIVPLEPETGAGENQ